MKWKNFRVLTTWTSRWKILLHLSKHRQGPFFSFNLLHQPLSFSVNFLSKLNYCRRNSLLSGSLKLVRKTEQYTLCRIPVTGYKNTLLVRKGRTGARDGPWKESRVVTKISSCRVNTISRQRTKQLGVSFGYIFSSIFLREYRGPPLNDSPVQRIFKFFEQCSSRFFWLHCFVCHPAGCFCTMWPYHAKSPLKAAVSE